MKKLYSLFLLLVLASCSSDDDGKTASQSISTTVIGVGTLYGNGSENIVQQNTIITNQADWISLVNQMDLVNNTSSGFTELNIDFNTYKILVAFDQIRPTGGFSIAIDTVVETENSIEATVNITGPGEVATMVMTQPFHIIKIPISTKPVVFL